MSGALDMSLDDIIKSSKKTAGGGRGRGREGGGPSRRAPNRTANRSAPYSAGKAPDSVWQHGMYSTAQAGGFPAPTARASSIETGTKLYISNLEFGVSNEDIKELFSEVGDLKRYSINYDRSGRSKGSAEVVFARRTDAIAAVKRYNNVLLDGKPMKIEIIGTNISTPAVVPQATDGAFGKPNGTSKSTGPARVSPGWPRAGGRGRGRSRGRGKGRSEPVSAEALDADLDKYHTEAMQTN